MNFCANVCPSDKMLPHLKRIREGTTLQGEKERRPQCGDSQCIKMIKGRPYFDKLGLAFYLKNP